MKVGESQVFRKSLLTDDAATPISNSYDFLSSGWDFAIAKSHKE